MRNNDATYTGLIDLRSKLDARHAELQATLKEVARDLESVSRTLALLDESSFTPDASSELASPQFAPIDTLSVEGLTQLQALIKIAQHGDGRLNAADAKRILVQAGLTKSAKNATNIIFNTIQRSGLFLRVGPGVYELIQNKPQRPTEGKTLAGWLGSRPTDQLHIGHGSDS